MSSSLVDDFTFQYTDTGVVLNDNADSNGAFVDITKVQGLSASPIRVTTRAREGQDGGFIDSQYEDMRIIIIEGMIYCPSSLLEDYLDDLKENFEPRDLVQPFYYLSNTGQERLIYCKPIQGLRYDWDPDKRLGSVPIQIQLEAENPSIFGGLVTQSTGIGGTSSTRGYNKSFNFGYGGSSSSASAIVCNNTGNRPADATFTITGEVDDPVVVNDTTGDKLDLTGFTIGSGETLTINLRNRSVLLNGTANRRSSMKNSSRWFLLGKGNTTIRFLGTVVSGSPMLTVNFRPAYR